MKHKIVKLFLLFFLFGVKEATSQVLQHTNTKLTVEDKMRVLHESSELHQQLSEKFGEDYSLDNQLVVSQLKTNITDKSLSMESRKISLIVYFGDDYESYMSLIENK